MSAALVAIEAVLVAIEAVLLATTTAVAAALAVLLGTDANPASKSFSTVSKSSVLGWIALYVSDVGNETWYAGTL
jgi:hypothetical protein